MKRVVSLLLIVCLAITLLAGCGGSDQPNNEPADTKKTMVIGEDVYKRQIKQRPLESRLGHL